MRVQLYGNTGYNSVDIPDSPDTLAQLFTPILTAPNVNLIQNDYISYLTLNITHKKARIIDYVIIIDDEGLKACYTVEAYEEVAKDIVKFKLLIDPYNTIGGLGLNSGNLIVAGSANRLTVSIEEDNNNFYVLSEPFTPSEKFKNEIKKITQEAEEATNYFIETITTPPRIAIPMLPKNTQKIYSDWKIKNNMYSNAIRYEATNSGEQILEKEKNTEAGKITSVSYEILKIPQMRENITTYLNIQRFNGTIFALNLQTRYWLAGPSIKYELTDADGYEEALKGDLIQDFRNNGRDEDIINFWQIPIYYTGDGIQNNKYSPLTKSAGETEDKIGGIRNIGNILHEEIISITPNANVFNKKTKYSQSIEVKVYSPVSAAELNKRIYEIINANTKPDASVYNANCLITADVRPQGAPIFMFKYLNGEIQTETPCELIEGGTWRNIPLKATGIDNENLIKYQINNEARTKKLGSIAQLGLGIGGILGGIALGAGSAASTAATGGAAAPATAAGALKAAGLITQGGALIKSGVGGFLGASAKQREQQEELSAQSVGAAAEIKVGNSNFTRDTGYNYFYCLITRYSDADMVAYDSFLTKYGYNVGNRPISNADFWSRPAFNYVKINDITIQSQTASLEMLEKVKQQLKAGVRIWHKAPNVNDMASGGNRQ